MIYALDGIAPQIDPDAWIAPGTHIIGDVTVMVGASIWFGTTIRGDREPIVVGQGSNVQENSVLHTDPGCPLTIGTNCTIGHKAMLHGCTIGDNSLIGMGATVLNGAVIGRNCLVGANALVTEGKSFPDNSLIVGAPARAVRTLDAEQVEGLKRSADNYVRNWKRFRSELRPMTPDA